MSSYIDHQVSTVAGYAKTEVTVTHDWTDFTAARLCWLYGPNAIRERAARTQADLAAWNALGQRSAA